MRSSQGRGAPQPRDEPPHDDTSEAEPRNTSRLRAITTAQSASASFGSVSSTESADDGAVDDGTSDGGREDGSDDEDGDGDEDVTDSDAVGSTDCVAAAPVV